MKKPAKPIAYEAYEKLADHYAAKIDTKPHNAFYDRPAVLSLVPEVSGKLVLDIGCGPGVYAEELAERNAQVIACDISDRMLFNAQKRLSDWIESGQISLMKVDLTKPLVMFTDEQFEYVNAPLCLDYIEDWNPLFKELFRVLKPGGTFVFSCGHPSFDAQYFKTQNYFSVEQVEAMWTGFGIDVLVPSFRRSIEELMMPPIKAGFVIDRVLEPQPTEAFRKLDLRRYKILMHRPGFICVRSRKPESA